MSVHSLPSWINSVPSDYPCFVWIWRGPKGVQSKSTSVFCVRLHGGLIRVADWSRSLTQACMYVCMYVGHWSADNANSDMSRLQALPAYVLAATAQPLVRDCSDHGVTWFTGTCTSLQPFEMAHSQSA